ncbi:IcmT/TraK family protein [Pseudoalteromonas nigrifaciens]|uniref:IcmT/TraK family protein n=1 Tax=Pseudoalteromonas nigrifaciens TaxID=28109 RepID=UPI003FD50D46
MKVYDDFQWWASSPYTKINLLVVEIDARVILAFVPTALHISTETAYFSISMLIMFGYLDYLGYSVPISIKRFRKFWAGGKRTVNSNKKRRRRLING